MLLFINSEKMRQQEKFRKTLVFTFAASRLNSKVYLFHLGSHALYYIRMALVTQKTNTKLKGFKMNVIVLAIRKVVVSLYEPLVVDRGTQVQVPLAMNRV